MVDIFPMDRDNSAGEALASQGIRYGSCGPSLRMNEANPHFRGWPPGDGPASLPRFEVAYGLAGWRDFWYGVYRDLPLRCLR
jgi:hypothetical protein